MIAGGYRATRISSTAPGALAAHLLGLVSAGLRSSIVGTQAALKQPMATAITTTPERIEYLKRAIAERRAHAADSRTRAIGAMDGRGVHHLNDAIRDELLAEGYERALLVLFP